MTRTRGRLEGTIALCIVMGALVGLVVACSGSSDRERARGEAAGTMSEGGELREPGNDARRCPSDPQYFEENLDTSGDNVADVRKVYNIEGTGADRHKVLACREMDVNRDGRKDVFRFYNDEGRPLREMADLDFNGSIDEVTFFEDGRVVREELDRNTDQQPDETRFYERGVLVRVDRDDNYDGRIDVWEHWQEGRILRIGYDTSGDQVADFWHRAPSAPEDRAELPPLEETEEEEIPPPEAAPPTSAKRGI